MPVFPMTNVISGTFRSLKLQLLPLRSTFQRNFPPASGMLIVNPPPWTLVETSIGLPFPWA